MGDGTFAEVVAGGGNFAGKFRDAFESYTPGQRWTQAKASGDLIHVDGNAVAASYLVISKSPMQQAKRAASAFRTSANFIAIAYLRMSKLKHPPASPFAPAAAQ